MHLLDRLYLISARGLPGEDARRLHFDLIANDPDAKPTEMKAEALHRRVVKLTAGKRGKRAPIDWPRLASLKREAADLESIGARIVWRGEDDYPSTIAEGMADDAPSWLILAGDRERLIKTQCAIVGSRETPEDLCEHAQALSRELSRRGIVIASGMARGADEAAHRGALEGPAGTVAVPARGILKAARSMDAESREAATFVSIALPRESFNPGLAIRRNDLIAALSAGLVLVASGPKGGSKSASGSNWASMLTTAGLTTAATVRASWLIRATRSSSGRSSLSALRRPRSSS